MKIPPAPLCERGEDLKIPPAPLCERGEDLKIPPASLCERGVRDGHLCFKTKRLNLMKISLIQINSSDDKEANFKKAEKYIIESAKQNPDVICLPEIFLYCGDDEENEAEKLSSKYINVFLELAKSHNVNLVLGSIMLKSETEDKNTNSSLIINRKGEIIFRYDKIYMYDVKRDGLVYKESDITLPGDLFNRLKKFIWNPGVLAMPHGFQINF
ncbi:MAG: nitrilase-related carbon-nitrogen hydrolase [bacterium]